MEVIRSLHLDTPSYLDEVRRLQPRVIFADPLTNTHDLRLFDLESFLKQLDQVVTDEVWVVIDGTMLSGALDPFDQVGSDRVKVLYYESGSKYLQLGLDLTLVGLVAVPRDLQPQFERLRRNGGQILDSDRARRLPVYDRVEFVQRMQCFSRNAMEIARCLETGTLAGRISPVYPLLETHPDYELAARLPYVGGLMTFDFEDPGFAQRHVLDAFIDLVMQRCKTERVPLTTGVSFGFSTPRISAAAAMAEGSPPFLRLSVGSQSAAATRDLAEILQRAGRQVLARLGADARQ